MDEFAAGADGRGLSLVFASHNLGQVKRLASRVVYLEHGRVLADLPAGDFSTGRCCSRPIPQPICSLKESSHDVF